MPLPLICHLTLTLAVGCAVGCGKNVAERPPNRTILPVSAAVVHHQPSFSFSVSYYGRIEPVRQAELSFELAGLLSEVFVDEGENVKTGDTVARLDTSLLEAEKRILLALRGSESALLNRLRLGEREEVIAAARAEVNRLTVEQTRLAADKGRAEKVYAGRSISRSDYDAALFSYEAAVHSLDQARQRLDELVSGTRIEDIQVQEGRVAEIDARIDLANIRLTKSILAAPYDGICVRRSVDEGVALSPGETVLQIHEADRLEARFSIPQQNLALIDRAEFLTIDGIKHSISGSRKIMQVDETTRTVDVVIPVQSPSHHRILPGQTCKIQVEKRVESECIELPLSSLVASVRGLWSCYRLRQISQASDLYVVDKYDVNIIHTDGERVFVSSTLPNRSLIVRDGVHKITPSMQVRIVDGDP